MKKIHRFTLEDIVRRRSVSNITKNQIKNLKNNTNFQDDEDDFNQNQVLANIFEQFKCHSKGNVPSLNNETKTRLVQIIGKKVNMKFNISKVASKLRIKKIQNIEILYKSLAPHNQKKDVLAQSINSKKVEGQSNLDIQMFMGLKKTSYFILSGSIHIYEKSPQETPSKSHQQEPSSQYLFYNWKQFQLQYPAYKIIKSFTQFTGYGQVFLHRSYADEQADFISLTRQNTASRKSQQLIIGESALVVQIENPEYENQYINLTGMDYEKMATTIEKFSIFNSLGKKIGGFVQFFGLTEYQRNQTIYSIGDFAQKFYLIIKGEVSFEQSKDNSMALPSSQPKQGRKNSISIKTNYKTQTMSSGNYFGQEEIVFKLNQRLLTAKCKSSKCQLLQIPKQKLEKMLQYSDFFQSIKKGADAKLNQRLSKLSKNKEIRQKYALTSSNEQIQNQNLSNTKKTLITKTASLFNTPKNGQFKVMHGSMIRQFSKQEKSKMNEQVQFSMLQVNPDMYEKTVDKFRKYHVKPRQKYVPEVNWQLKRVWKVLNLQNILRQQAQFNSSEGRQFYDSHKRYLYHIKQSKSLRPKTSSSTYRTKLQYIAYLQQFKGQK